jgi:hypothetical protein
MNKGSGDAIALFVMNLRATSDLYATYFTRADGWAEAELLATGKFGAITPIAIAIDPSGRALATWFQTDGTRRRGWASRLE